MFNFSNSFYSQHIKYGYAYQLTDINNHAWIRYLILYNHDFGAEIGQLL